MCVHIFNSRIHITGWWLYISPYIVIFHQPYKSYMTTYIYIYIQLYSYRVHHISLQFTINSYNIQLYIYINHHILPYIKVIIHRYTSIQHSPGASQRTTTGVWPRQPPRRPGPRPAQNPGGNPWFLWGKHGKSMGNLWKIPGNGMTLIQGGTPPGLSERWFINHRNSMSIYLPNQPQ